jgi:hypothetical protein
LEFDDSIIPTRWRALQENFPSQSYDVPLLLFNPGTQERIAAVGVVEIPCMRQRCHRLHRREITHGQDAFFRKVDRFRNLSRPTGEEKAYLEVQGVWVKHL